MSMVAEPSGGASVASRRGVRKSNWMGPRDIRHASPAVTSNPPTKSPTANADTVLATFRI
jgi:hypothetical protein